MVEAFAGAWAVAGPDDGRLGVVVGEDAAAGDGQVGVLLDVVFVGVAGGLRGALGLEVGIDGWIELAQVDQCKERDIPSSKVTSLWFFTQSSS